ncbi:ArnT family glycosyltransferase [Orrella daihaiensis]|uniref:Glycosyltransferase n=1 Tax=Orrella daihaiensis TaxID=2782176 RepID=A0ABY4ALK9_9BURK|nr:glycosyltransferase [Orrella daihaiensis]UOD51195.1 glycosyltransferase [Orrella daihaiensis]
MSLEQPTPARLTALATTRLPAVVLIGLLLMYALLGLFARDPWKTDDVVGLATMLTASAQGGWAWLFPHIGSSALPQASPLPTWIGGLSIDLLGPLTSSIIAARLSTLAWMLLTAFALWYASYLAGRRPEPQPVPLPFGGEPKVTQYGRLLADMSVLFLISTVGILLRTHETSEAPALLACQALAILGAVRLLDKPWQGTIILALSITGAFLTAGAMAGLPLWVASLIIVIPKTPLHARRLQVWIALALAPLLVFIWWAAVNAVNPIWASEWWFWNRPELQISYLEKHLNAWRDLPWFLWPTWPLAVLSLWNWRKQGLAPHVWIPGVFALVQLLNIMFTPSPGELDYMALTVPCAMLAAFSVPTLRRAVVNTLDWFALMVFSVSGAVVWLGWTTQQTGWPEKLAANIARQTVGYDSTISWGAFAMALVITGTWIGLIIWRLKLHPKFAWRGALLSAMGLTSTWILLVLLWMPTVDYVRSYRPMAAEVRQTIDQANQQAGQFLCAQSSGLSVGPRASLYVFEGIEISRDERCPLLIQQTTAERLQQGLAGFDRNARVLWTGSRGADRFDRYRVLLLTPDAKP